MAVTLEAKQLKFNEQLPAIDFISKSSSVIAIIGPTGSGKTQLLQTLAGIRFPLAGELRILGADPHPVSEKEWRAMRKSIAYIMSGRSLTSHLTVLNNLTLPLTYHGLAGQDQAEELAIDMLQRLDLTEYMRELPNRLNEAQRKKLLVGRALLMNPNIMFIEQAFTGFDALMREQLVAFYHKLVKNHLLSLILSTKDFVGLKALCYNYHHVDKIYFLTSEGLLEFNNFDNLVSSTHKDIVAYRQASQFDTHAN